METINALFASAVKRFPDRPALLEPAEESGKNKGELTTLTYRELQQRVEQFAGYLQGRQIAQSDRLLLWSASRINWVIAYLGGLLLGVVLVPLDVSSKEDFLTRVAETTEAKYLITTPKQYQSLKEPPLPLIDIDDLPGGDRAGLSAGSPTVRMR